MGREIHRRFRLGQLRRDTLDWLGELDRKRRRTRDVAVISYQKSGRTWLRFMLEAVGVRLMYDHAGAKNKLALPYEAIAEGWREWADWRVIFLFRDPRDTVVSSYFEATKRLKERYRFDGTLDEFMRDPRYGLEKIARFNLRWLEVLGKLKDGTSVAYEDLHETTGSELRRIVTFAVGRTPRDEIVERAVEAGRFANMRTVELSLAGKMNEANKLGGGTPGDQESFKTRRGEVGGWRDYFTPAQQRFMTRLLADLDYPERSAALHSANRRLG